MDEAEYLRRLKKLRPRAGKRAPLETFPPGSSVLDVPIGGTKRIPDTVLRRPPEPEDTITGLNPSTAQRHAEKIEQFLSPRSAGPKRLDDYQRGLARMVSQTLMGGDESLLPFGIGLQEAVPFSPYVGLEAGEMVREGQETGSPLTTGLGLGIGALQAFPAFVPLAKGAKAATMAAGRAGERLAERVVPQVMERGGLGAEMLGAMGTGSQSAVIKPKGGNWLANEVERQAKYLKDEPALSGDIIDEASGRKLFDEYRQSYEQDPTIGLHQWTRENYPDVYAKIQTPENAALNKWVDKKLTKYIKNEMGTPEDPVRALAEQGVLHYEPMALDFGAVPSQLMKKRAAAGMPTALMGKSDLARRWEMTTDKAIDPSRARDWTGEPDWGLIDEAVTSENPWLSKVPEDTPVYTIKGVSGFNRDVGFEHLMDELYNAVRPDSDLPAHLRYSPKDLEKVTVPQAVERVAKINEYRANKKAEANAAIARNPATFVVKEYPEQKMRWVELKAPDLPKGWEAEGMDLFGPGGVEVRSGRRGDPRFDPLEEALKYEGDLMGHCVGGYCPDVLEGRSRIYSLRDDKGNPRVTIEVEPGTWDWLDVVKKLGKNDAVALRQSVITKPPPYSHEDQELFAAAFEQAARQKLGEPASKIVQIKGSGKKDPQQRIRPQDSHLLPFIHDFIRGGKWSSIADTQNAGLRKYGDVFNVNEQRKIEQLGGAVPEHEWLTGEEIQRLHNLITPEGKRLKYDTRGNIIGSEDANYAQGGFVQDTDALVQKLIQSGMSEEEAMVQALRMAGAREEARMAGGGLAKAAGKTPKKAKKAAGGRVDAPEGAEDFIAQVKQRMAGSKEVKMSGGGQVLKGVVQGAKAAVRSKVPSTPGFSQFVADAPLVRADEASKFEFQTGRPVIVESYSGTRRDFSEIDPGLSSAGYFSSNKPIVANEYAGVYPEGAPSQTFPTGGNIQKSFIRMDNPLYINARGASFNRIDTRGLPGFDLPMSNTDMINLWAKQQGYDGVVYKDLRDSMALPGGQNAPASNVYVSFKPNYVKSAIGNRGTYDVKERDMTKAEGGAVIEPPVDQMRLEMMERGYAGGSLVTKLKPGSQAAKGAGQKATQSVLPPEKPRELTGLLRPDVDPVRGQTSRELTRAQNKALTDQQKEMLEGLKKKFPDFAASVKFMTPQEVGKILSNPQGVQEVNRLLELLPQAKQLSSVAKAGEAKRGWYRASTQALIDVFGNDAPRFATLLASLSPQTSVEMNLLNTLNVWKNWTAAGRPTDPAMIKQIMGQSVAGTKGEQSVLDAWTNNAIRSLTVADPAKVTLSGPKVDSFFRNLADDVYRVTNDAWMASGLGVGQDLFSGAPTALQIARGDPGLTPGYIATSARMREAGQQANMLPSEAQETTWSVFMPLYEMQRSTGIPARDILQRGLLTPQQIRGTPDFSSLLQDPKYGSILQQAGYGENLAALKPYQWSDPKMDLSLADQRELEKVAERLEGLKSSRERESRAKVFSMPSGRPQSGFAYETPEYISGRGTGHAEELIDAPLESRDFFSSRAANAFKDLQGHDVLQRSLQLPTIQTRSMTGAFRPPGEIPYASGRLGGETISGRHPVEVQPGFAMGAEVPILPSALDIPERTKRKLTAAAGVRGAMTAQLGSPWNLQIPTERGSGLFVPLDKKVAQENMQLSGALMDPNTEALADTGRGTALLNWGSRLSKDEAEAIAQRLGGTDYVRTKNVSDYVDYSPEWNQPPGSGAVTRKMLSLVDELNKADIEALSRATQEPAGKLYELYEQLKRTRGYATREDLMNLLKTLRDKGIPGVIAGLTAGEAFPAPQEKKAAGGLASLQRRAAHY